METGKRVSRWARGKTKRAGIHSRIAAHYAKYSGELPVAFSLNQDALTAKIVCEGSVHVSLNLFAEAMEDGNTELAEAIRASLADAREHLNRLDLGSTGTDIQEVT